MRSLWLRGHPVCRRGSGFIVELVQGRHVLPFGMQELHRHLVPCICKNNNTLSAVCVCVCDVPTVMPALTCALAQPGFKSLQEAVEQQLPSGQTGGWSALTPSAGWFRWITATGTSHNYTFLSAAQCVCVCTFLFLCMWSSSRLVEVCFCCRTAAQPDPSSRPVLPVG